MGEFYHLEPGKLLTHLLATDRTDLFVVLFAGEDDDGVEVEVMPRRSRSQRAESADVYAQSRVERAEVLDYPVRLEVPDASRRAAYHAMRQGGAVVRLEMEQPEVEDIPDLEYFFESTDRVRRVLRRVQQSVRLEQVLDSGVIFPEQ